MLAQHTTRAFVVLISHKIVVDIRVELLDIVGVVLRVIDVIRCHSDWTSHGSHGHGRLLTHCCSAEPARTASYCVGLTVARDVVERKVTMDCNKERVLVVVMLGDSEFRGGLDLNGGLRAQSPSLLLKVSL